MAALIKKQNKRISRRGADYVEFSDPLWSNFFGPNWLATVIYDQGRFWIDQGFDGCRLRYDLRSLHGMIFCLFAALMFFLAGFGAGGLLGGVKYAAGAFAWLYGVNLVLALVRVPHAIRRSVTGE
ncbi:MAG: hypothetical protein E7773_00005 [Sphingomonas sp.]|uniref:hypothetical protein n=1 Tax=Sphingomonas sp. TaxID=28214 RepID=UPI00122BE2A7|nr:hypothetical protein [Sphingomonas sp.]THD38181.1 MAG: hypothetical protein E7773_00005 [Sphingomonas sp.]